MVVKIRFGRGPVVTRRKGKNGRIAILAASLLTLVAVCFASLGFWRLAEDVDLAGGFVFAAPMQSLEKSPDVSSVFTKFNSEVTRSSG